MAYYDFTFFINVLQYLTSCVENVKIYSFYMIIEIRVSLRGSQVGFNYIELLYVTIYVRLLI